jgi:hypothetical protein
MISFTSKNPRHFAVDDRSRSALPYGRAPLGISPFYPLANGVPTHASFLWRNCMKKFLTLAASVATLAVAGTASAQVSQQVDINANVASKCGVSAVQTSVTLGDLTGADAKVRTAVTQEIATALNNAKIVPFCNAPNSQVEVQRAVLGRVGASGTGLADGGFAQYVRYNLDASVDNVFLDSTSTDGASPVANRFGGHISLSSTATHLKFVPSTTAGAPVASSNGSSPIANNWSSLTDRRLAAGNYAGYVNVVLTPGA